MNDQQGIDELWQALVQEHDLEGVLIWIGFHLAELAVRTAGAEQMAEQPLLARSETTLTEMLDLVQEVARGVLAETVEIFHQVRREHMQ
jgi:hypothetical protein